MIIQCEQCQAKFRLDDSKVTDKGVKVRCAKCKHVFTVTKGQPVEEPLDFTATLVETPSKQEEEPSFSTLPPQQSEAQEPVTESTFSKDFQEEASDSTFRMESSPFETTDSNSTPVSTANDEFSLSALEDDKGFAVERDEAFSAQEEVDFTSFDFGDGGGGVDKTMIAPPPSSDFGGKTMIQQPAPPVSAKIETTEELDFSDERFEPVTSQPVEEPVDSVSIDSGTASLSDPQKMNGVETEQKISSLPQDSGVEVPFSLGDIDFGDESTSAPVPQVGQEEPKPSRVPPIVSASGGQEKTDLVAADDYNKAFLPGAGKSVEADLPPLPIASRRKQSPLFVGLIAAAVLLVVGFLGYFGITSFSDDKDKLAKVAGKISVRAVKASYVQNAAAGLLLVISGEAVNEYSKPRAALQVKGMVFDDKGRVLANKSAFGGNILTGEQLASLPLDRIEAAMANQFGDSLANLEVAPGKSVSFMIVIANPPIEGKDFGVESNGSTVVADKQQK